MDCFIDVLTMFLDLGNISVVLLSMKCQRALRCHQKYRNLCSKDKQRSYGFGTVWGWAIKGLVHPKRKVIPCFTHPEGIRLSSFRRIQLVILKNALALPSFIMAERLQHMTFSGSERKVFYDVVNMDIFLTKTHRFATFIHPLEPCEAHFITDWCILLDLFCNVKKKKHSLPL